MTHHSTSWLFKRLSFGLSPMHVFAALIGLALIALGAILPELTDTWAFSVILLPTGTLLCVGVGYLLREDDFSPKAHFGLILVILGVAAINFLAVETASTFMGLRTANQGRVFRLPNWGELLILHVGWTILALMFAVGVSLIGRRSPERDIAVGLSLIAVYPLIGCLTYVLSRLVG